MPSRLNPSAFDSILALQLTVAWAGEAAGEPPRLGWWKSDLVDPEGGGDLFARLVPQTAAWASLSLVREVARQADQHARQALARPDQVWTLFHFGFALDEQLTERLAYHRAHRHDPAEVFGGSFLVGSEWSKGALEAMLSALGAPSYDITPAGRKLGAQALGATDAAPLLAAALLPLAPAYPLPFVELAK